MTESDVGVGGEYIDATCVDLFCGAGGLTHGLINAGLRVVAGVDMDEACRHPYDANNKGAIFYNRDISKLDASEVASWFGGAAVRVLAGCAPCQPFSRLARQNTEGTEKWLLLNHFGRIIREVHPDVVLMENVPNVVNHSVFQDFMATLEENGYHVSLSVVDCAKLGMPQRRRRAVLLASRYGKIELRPSTALGTRTVKDVLGMLPPLRRGQRNSSDPLHVARKMSSLNVARIKASKPGGTWRSWPKELLREYHRKNPDGSFEGVCGRMEWNAPSPTLTTQFVAFGSGRFGHPTQARALSLREGAILQGFPRNYSFVPEGSPIRINDVARLIGNAVPVGLARIMGQSVSAHLCQHITPGT